MLKCSGLYFPRTSMQCATCLPLTPTVPHCLRHRRDIADRNSKLQEYLVSEILDAPNPDPRYACESNDPRGLDQWLHLS